MMILAVAFPFIIMIIVAYIDVKLENRDKGKKEENHNEHRGND